MRRFDEKVALITGAARGLGKETAVLLAEEGARVCVADIDYDGVSKVEDELAKEGFEAVSFKADISKLDDIINMVNTAAERFGKIDILVNNAAVPIQKSMMDIEWEDWDPMLNVNIRGTFFVLQNVARKMIEINKGGSIVNISSIAGEGGRPLYIPYAATKAAVINITKSAAKELAKYRIRVNSVSPGNIDTQMLRDFAHRVAELEKSDVDSVLETWVQKIPLKHFARPGEIASAVLFLCSDEASYITGQILDVCGGLSIP
jgi:NAD(P)-dependent dehydrogenase (short-subunit alcohol dehydrogenase family)